MNALRILKWFIETLLAWLLPTGKPSAWRLGANSGYDVGIGAKKAPISAGGGKIWFSLHRGDDKVDLTTDYLTVGTGIGAPLPSLTFSLESFPSEGDVIYHQAKDDFGSAGDFVGGCVVIQVGAGLLAGKQATVILLGVSEAVRVYIYNATLFGESLRRAWNDGTASVELLRDAARVIEAGYQFIRKGALFRGAVRSKGLVVGLQAGVGISVSIGVVTSVGVAQASVGVSGAVGGSAAGAALRARRRKPRRP